MKRFLSFLSVCLFVLASCEPEPVLSLDKEVVEFGQDGGSQTVAVTANNTWNVLLESTDSFYTVSPTGGSENGFITITVKPNTTGSFRSTRIGVVCTSRDMSVTKAIAVSQSCQAGSASIQDIKIDPAGEKQVPAEGGTISFQVKANAPWTLRCDASVATLPM